MRNDCSINFHLSKLSIARFSILYDISLVRDRKRKLKLITFESERLNIRSYTFFFAYVNSRLFRKILFGVRNVVEAIVIINMLLIDRSISPNSRSNANFSFQFIASCVWYNMENLAGDLLLGLKFVSKLPILPTLFLDFVQGTLRELRPGYLGLKRVN